MSDRAWRIVGDAVFRVRNVVKVRAGRVNCAFYVWRLEEKER